uniref:Odorant receptor n=1 Tax=Drosicha corpulenta TaxID=535978 RepID=A0A0U3UL42_9HEMI|nr:odorant receptor 16 [Drosicha corpulenta]
MSNREEIFNNRTTSEPPPDDNSSRWLIVRVTKILLQLAGFFHVLDDRNVVVAAAGGGNKSHGSGERVYTIALNCFYVATFAGQLKQLQRSSGNLLAIFDVTFCAFGFVNCFLYLWVMRSNANTIRRIAKRIVAEDETSVYRTMTTTIDRNNYFERTSRLLKMFCTYCGPPYFTAVLSFSTFPLFIVLFTDNVAPGDPATMIYPSYYPWPVNTTASYMLTMICVQLPSISIPSFTYTATVGFVTCTMISLRQHFLIVQSRLKALAENVVHQRAAASRVGPQRDNHRLMMRNDSDVVNADLKAIIKYHQFIIEYIEDVMSCFQGIVTTTLTTFVAVMVMIPFLVTTIEGYYLYRMKMICAATVILIIFFIYCFIVEMINDLNESLGEALYNIPWYHYPNAEFRLILPIFIAQLQYRYQMKVFGMFVVNRAFFAQVMKLNFSVLNVTLVIYSRHSS